MPPRDSQGRFRGTPVHEDDYGPDSDSDSVTPDVPPVEQHPPFVDPPVNIGPTNARDRGRVRATTALTRHGPARSVQPTTAQQSVFP